LARSFAFHASRGKIFIPEEILAARGVPRGDILAGRSSDALRAALADFRSQARSHLDAIRDALTDLPDRFVDALLPVALLRPYLARMERSDYDPFRTAVEVPQWRKQWRLWRAARDPRRIAAG
jgi:phytoene synthase